MPEYRTQPTDGLAEAITSLATGDTLVVGAGEYAQDVKARPPAGVTIRFDPDALIRGLYHLSSAEEFRALDTRVAWRDGLPSTEHMVKFQGGSGFEVAGGELWGARSFAALVVTGLAQEFDIHDLYIHDTYASNGKNQDHLIYIADGSQGRIHHNRLKGAANGRGVKLGSTSSRALPVGIEVDHNTIVDCLGPSPAQFSNRAAQNVAHHNICVNSAEETFTVHDLTGRDNRVHDNIYWGSTGLMETSPGLIDGGGNRMEDPELDEELRPKADLIGIYGHVREGDVLADLRAEITRLNGVVAGHEAELASYRPISIIGKVVG
jgi:hypothetical protein